MEPSEITVVPVAGDGHCGLAMTNNRLAIALLLSTLLVACAGDTDDPPGTPDGGGDPSAELAAARAACRSSCDAIAAAADCPSGAAAAQAEECRATCAHQLEGTARCAPAGEALWRCLEAVDWACPRGATTASPVGAACTAEAEGLRTCILGNP